MPDRRTPGKPTDAVLDFIGGGGEKARRIYINEWCFCSFWLLFFYAFSSFLQHSKWSPHLEEKKCISGKGTDCTRGLAELEQGNRQRENWDLVPRDCLFLKATVKMAPGCSFLQTGCAPCRYDWGELSGQIPCSEASIKDRTLFLLSLLAIACPVQVPPPFQGERGKMIGKSSVWLRLPGTAASLFLVQSRLS